jgi:hypothetical protein
MPDLDFAFLCDYVRAEGGVAHVIAAGVDTVYAPAVPTAANLGILLRLTFTRNECGRPHRLEIIIQDIDGVRVAQLSGVLSPDWNDSLPLGWKVGMLAAFNLGLPIPRFGEYGISIMVNDTEARTIDFRAVQIAGEPNGGAGLPPES